MAPKKRKTAQPKIKKKKWFMIHAPALFNEVLIGETYLASPELLANKFATVNLSTLTKSMRKQNVNMQFKVTDVIDAKAKTQVIGYYMVTAAMKRLVRRGRDTIIDSFLAKTKDEKILRVKPMVITLNRGTRCMRSAVRLEARRYIREYFFARDTQDIFSEIVDEKLQKELKKIILKITPLKSIDFKAVKIEENAKVIINKDGVITEKVTIRRKEKGEKHLTEEELLALEQSKALSDEEQVKLLEETDFDDEESDDEDFGEELDSDEDESSIDDEELDLDEEEVDLIEDGEDLADDTTNTSTTPETVIQELDDEDSNEDSEEDFDSEEDESDADDFDESEKSQ